MLSNEIVFCSLAIQIALLTTGALGARLEQDNELEIKRAALPCKHLPNNVDPLEYHVSISLLDGFAKIKGKADILLKIAGKRVDYFHKFVKAVPNFCRSRPAPDGHDSNDNIILNMDSKLAICNATLEVSQSIKKLRDGHGKKISIQEIIIDELKQMILIQFENELPSGYYAKLTLHYRGSPELAQRQTGNGDQFQNRPNAPKPLRAVRLKPGSARHLFPCFDDPQFESRLRVVFYHPDIDATIVSNMPQHGRDVLMLQVASGASFDKTEFKQTEPMHVGRLSFALGPFYATTSGPPRDLSKIISLAPPHVGPIGREFMRESLERFAAWMSDYLAPITDKFKLDEPLRDDYLAIGTHTNSVEPHIETALTMALVVARKGFNSVATKSHSDHWIIDGLALHTAIRMVRDLYRELRVDQYVRSRLLPRSLELDARDSFAPVDLASSELELEDDNMRAVLLHLVKSAAIIDLIKLNIAPDEESFDKSVLALVNDNAFCGVETNELAASFANSNFSEAQIIKLVEPWVNQEGFPYVGVSLDRRGRRVSLDQVPVNWLDKGRQRTLNDSVWPLALRVKFSDDICTESRVVPITHFTDGQASASVVLPYWFNINKPGHKFWLALDEQSLTYYRVSYAIDSNNNEAITH